MKIGVRMSPHLQDIVRGIAKHGDVVTGVDDTGCDAYIAWGWPQAQDVAKKMVYWNPAPLICLDAHPFALQAGVRTGTRIIQINNWGALAEYAPHNGKATPEVMRDRSDPDGPALVIGQVYTSEQARLGLVDVWHTGGYEKWAQQFQGKPGFRFRFHPRVWPNEWPQGQLSADLAGVSRVLTWNSTCAVHARLMGYPAEAAEPHGWGHMSLEALAGQEWTPAELRSGVAWAGVREYATRGGS